MLRARNNSFSMPRDVGITHEDAGSDSRGTYCSAGVETLLHWPTRPGTIRTLRGPAIQIATAETTQQMIASRNARR